MNMSANQGITSEPGEYRFDVLATSVDGGPASARIYVEWSGVWSELKAWKG
jgi:hypothetical protein